MLLVEQEDLGDEKTVLKGVVSADGELTAVRDEAARLQISRFHGDDGHDDVGEHLTVVFEKLQALGADVMAARAGKILAELGFSMAMQSLVQGGWRMRISSARALFMQPTLKLLLGKPTDHLDLRPVVWLEQYLQR